MGLLSAFANRSAGEEQPETLLSDESTTEEFTEEETISSSMSLGSDDGGSAESNPPPKKMVTRKSKRQPEGKLLWQHNLSARSNQDIQRAYEENVLKEMTVILNGKTLNDTIARNQRSVGRSSASLGGLWTRLEIEWRESLSQRDFQLKSKNMLANKFKKPLSKF